MMQFRPVNDMINTNDFTPMFSIQARNVTDGKKLPWSYLHEDGAMLVYDDKAKRDGVLKELRTNAKGTADVCTNLHQ